jgi:hypothetical protein
MRGKQIIIAIDRLIVRESQLTPAQVEALRGRLEGELAGRLAREGGLVGLTSQARTSLTGPPLKATDATDGQRLAGDLGQSLAQTLSRLG